MKSVIKQPDVSARFPGNEALASLSAPAGNPALLNSNPPKVDYPRDKCIPEIFAARVQGTPAAVAVVFQDQPLTYRELDERANQLAHHLRTLGVQLETPVGVYMDRSANYVVSVLGILKAGGSYVPLATDYPVDRLQFMLQDAGLPVIVVDQPLPNGLDVRGHSVVDLAQDAPLIQALPKNALDLVCSAESLWPTSFTRPARPVSLKAWRFRIAGSSVWSVVRIMRRSMSGSGFSCSPRLRLTRPHLNCGGRC